MVSTLGSLPLLALERRKDGRGRPQSMLQCVGRESETLKNRAVLGQNYVLAAPRIGKF